MQPTAMTKSVLQHFQCAIAVILIFAIILKTGLKTKATQCGNLAIHRIL